MIVKVVPGPAAKRKNGSWSQAVMLWLAGVCKTRQRNAMNISCPGWGPWMPVQVAGNLAVNFLLGKYRLMAKKPLDGLSKVHGHQSFLFYAHYHTNYDPGQESNRLVALALEHVQDQIAGPRGMPIQHFEEALAGAGAQAWFATQAAGQLFQVLRALRQLIE